MERKCILSLFIVALLYAVSFEFAEGCSDLICRLAKKKAKQCQEGTAPNSLRYGCDFPIPRLTTLSTKCDSCAVVQPEYTPVIPQSYAVVRSAPVDNCHSSSCGSIVQEFDTPVRLSEKQTPSPWSTLCAPVRRSSTLCGPTFRTTQYRKEPQILNRECYSPRATIC